MSAHLRKELRALLPYWAGALAVVALSWLFAPWGSAMTWFLFAFCCSLLASQSVGHELGHRTFLMLLTQPIARSAVWRDKMLVLAGALAALSGLAAVLAAQRGGAFDARFLALVPLCALCVAPLFTLLSGSALGGLLFSLAVPGWFVAAEASASRNFPGAGHEGLAAPILLAFCAAAGLLAYLRFRTYQVRQGRPLGLGLPLGLFRRGQATPGRPLPTLLRKELRLQQATIYVALVSWGYLLTAAAVFQVQRAAEWGKVAAVVGGIELFALPLVAGAVAIGEERSMGIAEWQLAHPPSARVQWFAKLLVTLAISLLLGLTIPLLLLHHALGLGQLVVAVIGNLLLVHLSLYAASLAKGTVPALLLALGLGSAIWMAVASADSHRARLGPEAVITALAILFVILTVLLHVFAFSNFRRRRELRLGRMGLQGLAMGGVVAIAWALL